MSIKTVTLSPNVASFPLHADPSPALPPLLEWPSAIATFNPSETNTWFWDSCWMGSSAQVTGFQADWPESLKPAEKKTADFVAKIAWDIFCLIIFPLALFRLLTHYLHHLSTHLVLPAAHFDLDPSDIESCKNVLLYEKKGIGIGAEKISLTTPDGTKLEGAFIQGSKTPNKVIFYVTGNGGSLHKAIFHLHALAALGTSVFMINPRGVENKEGLITKAGLPLDTYTAYEYLIREKNFDPNHILGLFFSMGGGTGNIAAALIQEKYPASRIKVINDRSFSDVRSVATAHLSPLLESPASAARVTSGIVLSIFDHLDWNIDSGPAFQRLKGDRCIIYNKGDQIIKYRASLFHKIEKEGHPFGTVHCLELQGNGLEEHMRRLTLQESRWVIHQINTLLDLHLNTEEITAASCAYSNPVLFWLEMMADKDLTIRARQPASVESQNEVARINQQALVFKKMFTTSTPPQ